MKKFLFISTVLLATFLGAKDEYYGIGSVDTKWNLLGKDDRIEVIAVKDPKIDGVTCYVSYAKKGGTKELFGLEEDTSDASVSCVQTAKKITIKEEPTKEDIFTKRSSLLFKKTHVVRMFDEKERVFTYLIYSDRVIEGSPKNSVSAIPCVQANMDVCEFSYNKK